MSPVRFAGGVFCLRLKVHLADRKWRQRLDADSARFTMTIENVPSENPRTGKITALSVVAALRGLVSELKVGT